MILKIKKLNPEAQLPQQMTEGSVGFDLSLINDIAILPTMYSSQPVTAKLGIAIELPKGYYAEIVLRSSIGAKTKVRLANQVGIIDSDYRGELMLHLENVGNHTEILKAGQRIAQMLIHKVEEVTIEETDVLSSTERGEGATGSTDVPKVTRKRKVN